MAMPAVRVTVQQLHDSMQAMYYLLIGCALHAAAHTRRAEDDAKCFSALKIGYELGEPLFFLITGRGRVGAVSSLPYRFNTAFGMLSMASQPRMVSGFLFRLVVVVRHHCSLKQWHACVPGQSSPSTNGVITMIKTSLADSTANLAKQVDDSVAAADKKIDGSLRDTETEVKKAVADSTKCNTNGFALKDGGGCTAAPWVVASADNLACSSANIGGLRYDQKAGGILVCSKDQKWTAVAPPSLGAFKTSGAKGCDTIKKAGFDAGNKLYWLHPSGAKDPFLVWCDMSGDGKPIHDGSSKERPATSCLVSCGSCASCVNGSCAHKHRHTHARTHTRAHSLLPCT